MIKNLLFLLLSFSFQNSWAQTPNIFVSSETKTLELKSAKLEGIMFTPLRSLKEEWDKKHFSNFLSVFEVEVPNNTKITAQYEIPKLMKNAQGLRISIFRVTSEDGKVRTMDLLHSKFYQTGQKIEFPVTSKKRTECFYIVTAEATQNERETNKHIQYMSFLQGKNKTLVIEDIGTNFTLSDIKFSMKTTDEGFKLLASDGYARLHNPYWIMIVYPHYTP